MKILLVLVSVATVVAYAFGHALYGEAEEVCPPPEQVKPCTCFKAPDSERVTALCSNFSNAEDIKEIFNKNPGWNLQDVHIHNSIMPYLPANILEQARFQSLNVSSTTLVTLFDMTPVNTPELNLYLYNVKLLRSFQWSDIANSSLLELGAVNMHIKNFGKSFKDNIPRVTKRLWFENTNTRSITHEAFSVLENLEALILKGGSLRTISRDMFPRPWKVTFWDMSFQRISALPEDIFADEPNLAFFAFQGNLLTTMSEKVFTKSSVFYALNDNPINCNCKIKWITTQGKIIPNYLKGTCAEPESLKGRNLADLKNVDFSFCT